MTTLVLKGHTTRGMEVIQLLVMLGAKSQYTGTFKGFYYWIEDGQVTSSDVLPENSIIFSLEEFEEKYPYKVGYTVACYVGIILEKEAHKIIGMQWDSNKCRILYLLDNFNVIEVEDILYSIECKTEQSKQKKIKGMDNLTTTNEEAERNMIKIPEFPQTVNLNQSNVNEIEVVLGDYEFVLKDGKTYFVKKNKYPKTYEECCKTLGYNQIMPKDHILGYRGTLLSAFQQLLICRDAWWKMADDWKPDWTNFKVNKFCIGVDRNITSDCNKVTGNKILAFPTAEMRDEFYENFKDLINEVKELL